jgi:hypothetical protein
VGSSAWLASASNSIWATASCGASRWARDQSGEPCNIQASGPDRASFKSRTVKPGLEWAIKHGHGRPAGRAFHGIGLSGHIWHPRTDQGGGLFGGHGNQHQIKWACDRIIAKAQLPGLGRALNGCDLSAEGDVKSGQMGLDHAAHAANPAKAGIAA